MSNGQMHEMQSSDYHLFLLIILAMAWFLSQNLPFHPH